MRDYPFPPFRSEVITWVMTMTSRLVLLICRSALCIDCACAGACSGSADDGSSVATPQAEQLLVAIQLNCRLWLLKHAVVFPQK